MQNGQTESLEARWGELSIMFFVLPIVLPRKSFYNSAVLPIKELDNSNTKYLTLSLSLLLVLLLTLILSLQLLLQLLLLGKTWIFQLCAWWGQAKMMLLCVFYEFSVTVKKQTIILKHKNTIFHPLFSVFVI